MEIKAEELRETVNLWYSKPRAKRIIDFIDTLKKENEQLRGLADKRLKELSESSIEWNKENTKLKEALKDIRSQLFDSKNCETILTKSIDALLKD